MNVAFFHDSVFIKKGKDYYTSGTLNNELFAMYQQNFKNISIVTRYKDFDETQNSKIKESNKITLENINFRCVKNYKNALETVKKEIIKCDFAIIRCHSIVGTIAAYYAKKYNKKYMVESVSCAFDCLWYHSWKGKIIAPVMYYLTKKVIKDAVGVAYVSQVFLQKRYPNRNQCLACSDVVIEKYDITKFKKNLKKYNDILERKIIIGNIANIDMKYKGQQYLIKATSQLIEKGYNIELQFVGGGTGKRLKKYIKKYNMEKNVVFKGMLTHKEIFDFLEKIDIYVQPSNAEAISRVIIEAMSVGCPIIGSDAGGIPELIHQNFVFKKKNVRDLKNKIELLLQSDIKKYALYSYNRSQDFEYKKLLEKKVDYYKKIKEENL